EGHRKRPARAGRVARKPSALCGAGCVALLREAGRWPEGPDGVQNAGLDRCRFAVTLVQSDFARCSGPHPIRRSATPSPAKLVKENPSDVPHEIRSYIEFC